MSDVESHASGNSEKVSNLPSPESGKSDVLVENDHVSQAGHRSDTEQQDFFSQLNDKLNASIENARINTRSGEKNLNRSKIPLPSGLANPTNARDKFDVKNIQSQVAGLADTGGKLSH